MCTKCYDHWMCGWVVWLKMYNRTLYCFGHFYLGFSPPDKVGKENMVIILFYKCEPVIKIIACVLGWLWLQMDKLDIFLPFYPLPPPPLKDRKMEFSKALKTSGVIAKYSTFSLLLMSS